MTALRSFVQHHDVTWIASAMTDEDRTVAEEAGGKRDRGGRARRLVVPAAARLARSGCVRLVLQRRREPDALVPPALPLGPRVRAEPRRRRCTTRGTEGYVAVNAGFADAVLAELERSPTRPVFFHDYHLYLAPRIVRERRPDTPLAHFVHIPWPQPDYWHVLPLDARQEVHDGLLANDVVGFHTDRWRRNFLRSCADILGVECDFEDGTAEYDERRIQVTSRPISVDPAEFDELAVSDVIREREEELVAGRPERLVLRVDRTDPSKNVVRGFRAFELYLDRPPGVPRAGRDARAARPVAAGHPGVRRVPRRDPARGPRRQRPLPAGRLDADRPADRGQLPAGPSPRTSSTTCCS